MSSNADSRRMMDGQQFVEVLVSYDQNAEARILRQSEGISTRVTQKGIGKLLDAQKDYPVIR